MRLKKLLGVAFCSLFLFSNASTQTDFDPDAYKLSQRIFVEEKKL
jgi:hypothetical protein